MTINEEKGNLFDLPEEYALAHCISEDCALGAGIAVEFQRRFKIRDILKEYIRNEPKRYPRTIWTNTMGRLVFNMITKEKYWHKPTRENFELALEELIDDLSYLDEGDIHAKKEILNSYLETLS